MGLHCLCTVSLIIPLVVIWMLGNVILLNNSVMIQYIKLFLVMMPQEYNGS